MGHLMMGLQAKGRYFNDYAAHVYPKRSFDEALDVDNEVVMVCALLEEDHTLGYLCENH